MSHPQLNTPTDAASELRGSSPDTGSFELLFRSNPQPTWVYDLETFGFLEVNLAAERHYGFTRDEFLAMTLQDIRPPVDVPALLENARGVMHGVEDAGVWRHRTKRGGLIEVHITSHVLSWKGRRAELVVARDVTAERRAQAELQEREQQSRALFELAGVGVAQIETASGRFVRVNRRYCEILGRAKDEVLGHAFAEFTHPEDLAPDLERTARLAAGEFRAFMMEKRHLRPDGSIVWVSLDVTPMWPPGGEPVHHIAVVQDISDRMRAEQALREREHELEVLVDNEPECVKVIEATGRLRTMNRAGLRMLEASSVEEVRERGLDQFVLPEHRAAFLDLHRRVLTGETCRLEFEVAGLRGSRRWLETVAAPLREGGEKRIALVGITRDVTEAHRARELLLESRRRYQDLVSNLPGYVYRIANDEHHTPEFISEGVVHVTGYSQGEYLVERTITCGAEIHPEDANRVFAEVQAAVGALAPYECVYRLHTKQGELRWVWVRGRGVRSDDGELVALEGFVTDITRQRAAEEALRENRARLDSILESLDEVVWSTGPDGEKLLFISDAAERLYGRPAAAFYADPMLWLRCAHPEDRPRLEQLRQEYTRTESVHVEYRIVRPDGSVRWISDRSRLIRDPEGRPLRIDGLLTDVTERKEAEIEARLARDAAERTLRELRATTAQLEVFQRVAHLSGQGLGWARADTSIRYVNPALGRMLGLEPGARTDQRSFFEFYRPEDQARLVRVLAEIVPGGGFWTGEIDFVALDGRCVPTIQNIFAIPIEGDSPLIATIVTDISDQRRTARRIEQLNEELERRVAERTLQLEAMNRELETFTYSVSHDLKAPLRGLEGFSALLIEDFGDRLGDEGKRYLESIRNGAKRMKQLIEDLLAYSRLERHAFEVRTLDLRRCIEPLVQERDEELRRRGVDLVLEIEALDVQADPQGLAIAFRNLFDNALKFTGAVERPRIEVRARAGPSGCTVSVTDNGLGFEMRYHDRVFQIFQRLERAEDYPGTGIGLAMVQKAMARMGGRVWAESARGSGSTFYLELPGGARA